MADSIKVRARCWASRGERWSWWVPLVWVFMDRTIQPPLIPVLVTLTLGFVPMGILHPYIYTWEAAGHLPRFPAALGITIYALAWLRYALLYRPSRYAWLAHLHRCSPMCRLALCNRVSPYIRLAQRSAVLSEPVARSCCWCSR